MFKKMTRKKIVYWFIMFILFLLGIISNNIPMELLMFLLYICGLFMGINTFKETPNFLKKFLGVGDIKMCGCPPKKNNILPKINDNINEK